ncbi:HigA family addiction module antitoxin [Roseomonas sp. NAR14]|uniref:HigA family addiction module antitoxin n=1 Tax=Roseomonas acroporae TaxID=2937791 RepID=A0A9X1YKB4_9PROT|nr:HigA family addiction module antitoxin [Roseomonas acroporae]MCK8787621.1 HigA family addiction module antitoxin [Roseomonas acroporae]
MTDIQAARRPAFEPTHPGVLLRDTVLPAIGLSVTAAAERLGVSRQALHAILAEKAAVSPEMAARLARLCGNSPDLWLRMQQNRDLWRVERDMAEELGHIEPAKAA